MTQTTPSTVAATEDHSAWIGREEERHELVSPSHVAAAAAMFDMAQPPVAGQPLPPGWQWLFFNPAARQSELGPDGHPRRGGFLPPIGLPRRMWAGSRLRYLEPLRVGEVALRRSRILRVEGKTGRQGPLWFVTVEHTLSSQGRVCIVEEQDLVYREAAVPGAPPPAREPFAGSAQWSREILPDTTLLFRYSALTLNGHRIHYDADYAREVEGYSGLVVHGPLVATLLQQFVSDHFPGRRLTGFDFRGVSPMIVGGPLVLQGREGGADGRIELWALGSDRALAMQAHAVMDGEGAR